MPKTARSQRPASSAASKRNGARVYDRPRAENYWGEERRPLHDEFKIVLSAG